MLEKDITVVILAGGRGRRMDEQDKGLVILKNQPLIEHVINAISSQNANILINANQNIEQYRQFGFPVVSDEVTGFQGPLAGVASAMGQVETPYILTLPCDAPFVEHDYQAKMWAAIETQQTDLVVAYSGQRLQSIHALIPVRLYTDLLKFLGGNTRRVDAWYSQYAMGLVDFSEQLRMFCNLNTPEELKAYSIEKKFIS
jgi:molybdenum cofactor guanylyltransferase